MLRSGLKFADCACFLRRKAGEHMRDDVELAADDAREEGREEERQRYFSERAALESNNAALESSNAALRAEIFRLRMLLAAQGG